MALDKRNYNQLVETTVALADKVGCSEIVSRIVEDLKDEQVRRGICSHVGGGLRELCTVCRW